MFSNVQVAAQRFINFHYTYSGIIGVPTALDFSLDILTPSIYAIISLAAVLRSGTLTLKASSTAGDIAGLTAIAVTSVQATTLATAGDSSLIVAAGSRLFLTISAPAAPVDFQFSLKFRRI